MSDLVETCRTLLDNYPGENKQVLQRIWDHYEDSGELEDNLLKGFDDESVDITAEQFIEIAGQLEGEQLENFYTELDTSKEFAQGIIKEVELLPDIEHELKRNDEIEDDDTEGEPASADFEVVSEEPQSQTPKFTRDELREAIADPRYKNSPGFRAAVESGFNALYGDESAAESNPSSGRSLHGVREESTGQEEHID